ncbi:MAG: hypothetical protein DRQ43_08805 [Gammaproteobacteria bacterium]|nr:MAG: hypothetical protein DRQ43_08805 [Gammaproteobacteria bacterium]
MYTHCPSCDTYFEITQESLDIAQGKVRCGQCDHVFNALDNLYNDEPDKSASKLSETAPEIPKLSSTYNKNQLNTAEISIPKIDIQEKMERIVASLASATEELKNARQSATFHKEFVNKKSEHKDSPEIDELDPIEETPQGNETPDDINSLDLDVLAPIDETPEIDETSDNINSLDLDELDPIEETPEIDETPDDINSLDLDELAPIEETPEIDETSDEINNLLDKEFSSLDDEFDQLDDGQDLLAELDQLEDDFLNNKPLNKTQSPVSHGSDTVDPQTENSSQTKTIPADDYFQTQNPSQESNTYIDDFHSSGTPTEKTEDTVYSENSESDSDVKVSPSSHTQEEVVPSFLTQKDSSSSSPTAIFGWLAATIVLLVVLAAQYLHFNSTQFSQDKEIRPLLDFLCPLTGCPLPLIKTPGKIVTVTHDVRTHPTVKNALEIQLIFKNKAAYTQSYPILEITFSNPVGEVIARRKFLPDEYIKTNNDYHSGLKNNQKQEINLKIVDPDPSSLLSFQFNYL